MRCLLLIIALAAGHARVLALDETYNPDAVAREFLWNQFQSLPPSQRPKIGLALSAGGARGFAHVGVVEVLANAGFPVDCIAGTSMGAVVGSMFSAGLPLSRLWEIGEKASLANVSKDINTYGLLRLIFDKRLMSSSELENFIVKTIGDISFQQLRTPFACSAMDIKTGEKIVFREGPVANAVRASMNLPGIFQPVEYRHRLLVDGGVVDFLPVASARNLGADWVIASITLGDYSSSALSRPLAYLMQVMDIRGSILAAAAAKEADFVIRSPVGDISAAELHRSVEAGNRGVEEAYKNVDKAKENLIIFSLGSIAGSYIGR